MKPLLATLLLLTSLPAAAEIYQWTDANGRVHFGDKPAGDAKAPRPVPATAPRATASPAAPAASDAERAERQRRLLQAMAQERADKERQAQEREAREQEQRRKCIELRNTLKDSEGRLIYTTDDSGVDRYLSEEERVAYIGTLRATLQEHCE